MSSFRTLAQTVRQYVRTLSPPVEFSIIFAGAFGLPIFKSIRDVFEPTRPLFPESKFERLVIAEIATLAVLLIFLHIRGWTLKRIGLSPSAKDTLIGLGLAYATHMAYVAAWQITAVLFSSPTAFDQELVEPDLRLTTLVAASVLNSFFEEIFVCGYVMSALERARWSTWASINVSVAVRVIYHLYQGAIGVISIVPNGFIFAYWYARTDRLWPLIVAHAVLDFVALLPYLAK